MKTILNFGIESTDEKLTPRVSVVIFGEYLKGTGVDSRYRCQFY